ncbi:hypothetical protein HPB52_014981 [Rhipicephalus sanguineus]|uniref:5'-nucleotidase n=1 Tax=Rhipicephalus sanguineus TaxID=34632 RepID=A0A9D4Q0P6_RHISA|nr:hypothetical protein HPB52_014981 [Rhipicephalus sanguineus]
MFWLPRAVEGSTKKRAEYGSNLERLQKGGASSTHKGLQKMVGQAGEQAPFTLTVLHTNDVHAHIEESTKNGAMCSEKDKQNKSCVGGVARIKTKVKELKTQYPGALFMNAGDFFQGTAWYTVLKEKIISAVMTRMDYDYVCLGNHEFDDGPEGLAHHLLALQKANVTIVGTNTNFSDEPALRNISLPKSVKIKINNVTVGIVGAVLPETRFLSNTGKVQFEDEIQSIRREAEKLESEEVKVIVAITHSGYPRDIEIVKQVEQLDLLVGGHTNTFLYHGQGYPKENTPEGDYPTVVNRSDGSIGLVVQDYWFGKFLGFLQVSFDNNGKVTKWTGNPVLLNSSVQEDQEMLDVIDCYKENVTRAISESRRTKFAGCESATLGNLIADGFFAYYADKESSEPGMWSDVNGALFNGGAVRAPIPQNRNITMGHILATMPFGMSVVIMTLNGSELRSMFEYSVSEYSFQKKQGRFLQVSEFHSWGPQSKLGRWGRKSHRIKLARNESNKQATPFFLPADYPTRHRYSGSYMNRTAEKRKRCPALAKRRGGK